MPERDATTPSQDMGGTDEVDDSVLGDDALDDVSGGLEVSTDIVSIRAQQQLTEAGRSHQIEFPRLKSRFADPSAP